MNHISAPATVLIATRCACCGIPLVDAESVEMGIGPICRRNHGFAAANQPANWAAVAAAFLPDNAPLAAQALAGDADACLVLEDALLENVPELGLETLMKKDGREAANALVHRCAIEQSGAIFRKCTIAIAALGFVKLAEQLVKREGGIRVVKIDLRHEDKSAHGTVVNFEGLGVFLPGYNADFIGKARGIGGRPFKVSPRVWRWDFPMTARKPLWDLMKSCFPCGTPVSGEKGVSVL